MPVIYVCRVCGFKLYEFERVGQDYFGVPTPSEVINWYGGVCPKCNSKLNRPSLEDIVIKPLKKTEYTRVLALH